MHVFRHFFEVKMHIFHETNIAINSGNVVFLPSKNVSDRKKTHKKTLILVNKITKNYNIW